MLDATLALMLVINVALLAIAPGAPQRHEPPIWIVHLNVNIRSRDNLKHSFKVQFDDEPTAVDASSTSSPDVPLRLTAVNHKIDLHDEDIQLPLAKRRPVRAAAQRRATSSRLNMQLNPVISSVFLHAGNSRVFVIPAYNQVPGLVRHNYNIEADDSVPLPESDQEDRRDCPSHLPTRDILESYSPGVKPKEISSYKG
ncbi:hypothetical protein FB45DRAFT_868010 [Roridomyces roridus]|uniref:Uncharacterized protein n=1 Tax=Roridomyces roridus TaxID=1738132 RepID=A0AAD7FKI3_9AGAR|nr:hypothetical protein FB45DRAFT_868010 [Roridomyces roridus]